MPRITVVGVDHVARRAAGRPVVAGLVVSAQEPGERVVEPRFVDIDQRYRDACTGTRSAIRLADIGTARFLEPLDLADDVRYPGLGKQVDDVATAGFENAKYVTGLDRLPGG